MFPGPAQRKQIDKIGQIFSGFLSTCFLGPNPSNIWMFEKWKQHCWQVFLRAFFWWDLRKTNQNSCIMSPNFPWPALQKKLYIYYIILYYIILYIKLYIKLCIYIYTLYHIILHIHIYIFVHFFCRRFSRDQPSKKINIFVRFFRSQPSPPNRKNKQTYILFIFCHRFARGQPSKKYKFEKKTYIYIFVSVFFRCFSRHQPSKKYKF